MPQRAVLMPATQWGRGDATLQVALRAARGGAYVGHSLVAPAQQLVIELADAMALDSLDEKWHTRHALPERLPRYVNG